MAGVFSHPAPALALAVAFGSRRISPRLAVAAVAASLLPDLDVVGFKLGITYGEALGRKRAFTLFCCWPLVSAF